MSDVHLSSHLNGTMEIPLYCRFSSTKPFLTFIPSSIPLLNQHSLSSISLSDQTKIQDSILCARSNRRPILSRRARKFILESVHFVASNLNVMPMPLALAIREFVGGNGGGIRFPKGLGGGGSDEWRRNGKKKLGFFAFLIGCGFAMWFVIEKELDPTLALGVLGVSLLGFSIDGWRRGVKDWILGFCFCAVVVVLGWRTKNLQRWAKGLEAMKKTRRRKRKAAM